MSKVMFLLSAAAVCVSTATAQDQPIYIQHFCVKVNPGKNADFMALRSDVVKLMRVRVESGQLEFFLGTQATIPAGAAARCDYNLVYGYNGYPPAPRSREQSEADFHKAGIAGTYTQMLARRDATSTLVSNDLFRSVKGGTAGPGAVEGGYIRLNLYKIKPGHTVGDWAKLETEGWQPFAEALAKETPGIGWRASGIVMPGGTSVHYNAETADIFPTWAAAGKGFSTQMWSQVHPDLNFNTYIAKVNDVADRYRIELYRVNEVVRKK